MRALRLHAPGQPLSPEDVSLPTEGTRQVLLRVRACAVCRTDLHVVDGDLSRPKLPLIPGHEIVGEVVQRGTEARRFAVGERVGLPWLGWTCGVCSFCTAGAENLCSRARFTGYTLDGGYAEYALADERFCFALPTRYDDLHAAPLLCAGLIGFRSYRMATERPAAGEAARLGLFGFGAAAHLIAQLARVEGRSVFAFTRPGDRAAQDHARSLGVAWAGGSDQPAPEPLDAAILFAPIGQLVPIALQVIRPGGVVVCAGIHMSDIPGMAYELLWGERCLRSVANLTRRDGQTFLEIAARVPLRVDAAAYPLSRANEALIALRDGRLQGAAVLMPGLD